MPQFLKPEMQSTLVTTLQGCANVGQNNPQGNMSTTAKMATSACRQDMCTWHQKLFLTPMLKTEQPQAGDATEYVRSLLLPVQTHSCQTGNLARTTNAEIDLRWRLTGHSAHSAATCLYVQPCCSPCWAVTAIIFALYCPCSICQRFESTASRTHPPGMPALLPHQGLLPAS